MARLRAVLGVVLLASTGPGLPPRAAPALSEPSPRPSGGQAHAILARPLQSWDLGTPARALAALGPTALPELVDLVPMVESLPLRVAAMVLAEARYRPAAPALARRLSATNKRGTEDILERLALLDALSRLGGGPEVAPVARLLRDRTQSSTVRIAAAQALAGIGNDEARTILEAAVPRHTARGWWRPPSPAVLLPLLDRNLDAATIEKRRREGNEPELIDEVMRMVAARGAARAPLPGGRSLLVFPNGWLYLRDELWAVELDSSGKPAGPARCLGVRAPGAPATYGVPIQVRVDGRWLTITRTESSKETVRVDLAAAAQDTDGDGIPDLVERRLLLDPTRSDSDGDGVPDPMDAVPNAAPSRGGSVDGEIERDFFVEYFAFAGPREGPIIVASDHALADYGREGPTLVLTRAEANRQADIAAKNGREVASLAFEAFNGRSAADERTCSFSESYGPMSGASYRVIMRRLGGRWYIRSMVRMMVS
jgi:hypothetical protein